METLLITIDDILQYRQIDRQKNTDDLNGRILSVQRNQLRNLLSDAFYYDLINNVAGYTALIDGESYTNDGDNVQYFGLKPFIVFHVLNSLVTSNNFKLSDMGNVNMLDTTFNKASAEEIREIKQEFTSEANNYRNNIIEYLEEKKSTYTLYESKNQKPTIDFDIQII